MIKYFFIVVLGAASRNKKNDRVIFFRLVVHGVGECSAQPHITPGGKNP
ncbi:MAG: hypothetical protein H9789_13205 [Candidatus Paraprevotella stercoravium]|uniref:Uncharacterized protein n=1 Tax=Candidatus Paraprevotella stercoravium TaxID=2838725 RepID=A0A9E2L823_9BACT|nr:hypothetical protein [Candidatus Paraprevotella stercoravium]